MEECYVKGLGLNIPDSPVIIDIGANAGFFLYLLHRNSLEQKYFPTNLLATISDNCNVTAT
jgi:hypothetical protein